MWLCFIYFTRIVEIIEVVMYYIHIDWLRCIIIPSIETILCTCIEMRLSISWARGDRPCWGCWDVKIVIWVRGNRPCGNCLILWWCVEIVRTDTWRSSVSVYGPRESLMGHELSMYFRGVSCIYGWVSTGYSETYHYMVSYCIAFYHIIHFLWLCVLFVFENVIYGWLPLLMKLK